MRGDDELGVVLLLGGLWLLSKYEFGVAPKLERAGSRAYDWLHNDAGHVKDLPGHQLTRAALMDIATRAGFPDPHFATAIALAESGGVPNAITDTRGATHLPPHTQPEYSIGLFQINLLAHPEYTREQMSDPHENAAAAFKISKGGTEWRWWGSFTDGRYKQFLEARA